MSDFTPGPQASLPTYGLLNDVLFNIVFGNPKRERLLRALLNALLGYEGPRKIIKLTLLTPTLEKSHLLDKGSILDLHALDSDGKRYNIEVQLAMGTRDHFIKRTLYYLARLYSASIEKGDSYGKLAKTISISLLNFQLFKDLPCLHSTFHMRECKHGLTLSEVLEIHYVELPKFRSGRLETPFERWLDALTFSGQYAAGEKTMPEESEVQEEIVMAIDALKEALSKEHVRELIRMREKAEHDHATRMEEATQQGLEQGRRKGVLEVAARMREQGLDLATIEQLTGLSRCQLEPLPDSEGS